MRPAVMEINKYKPFFKNPCIVWLKLLMKKYENIVKQKNKLNGNL